MKNIINLIVEQNTGKKRVDTFIFEKCSELSRTRIKNLIISNKLKINGKINKLPSKKINSGDFISLEIPKPKKTSLKPFNYSLDIIYQDDDLIVINKSSGISMHPGPGNYDNTVVNALMNYDKIKLSLPQFGDISLVAISALKNKGLDKLKLAIVSAKENWNKRFTTAKLNNWLSIKTAQHPPPMLNGKRLKLR